MGQKAAKGSASSPSGVPGSTPTGGRGGSGGDATPGSGEAASLYRTFQPLHAKAASLPRLEASAVENVMTACQHNVRGVNQDITIKQDAIRRAVQRQHKQCAETARTFANHERQVLRAASSLADLSRIGTDLRNIKDSLQDALEKAERVQRLVGEEEVAAEATSAAAAAAAAARRTVSSSVGR